MSKKKIVEHRSAAADTAEFIKLLEGSNRALPAKEVAASLSIKVQRVYRIARMARKTVGIHNTINGYRMSKFCNRDDDHWFLHRFYGFKIGQAIALNSAKPYILERASHNRKDMQSMKAILGPILSNPGAFKRGHTILRSYMPKRRWRQ